MGVSELKTIVVLRLEANALFARRVKGLCSASSASIIVVNSIENMPTEIAATHANILFVDPAVWATTPAITTLAWRTVVFTSEVLPDINLPLPTTCQIIKCAQDPFAHPRAAAIIGACIQASITGAETIYQPWAASAWQLSTNGDNWRSVWAEFTKEHGFKNFPAVQKLSQAMESILSNAPNETAVEWDIRSCGARFHLTLKTDIGRTSITTETHIALSILPGVTVLNIEGSALTLTCDIPILLTQNESGLLIVWSTPGATSEPLLEVAG